MKAKTNAATPEALDPVGVQGAPTETLETVLQAIKNLHLERATITLLTDWQDRRANARYAVLVREGIHTVLSVEAFGPRYGESGQKALESLMHSFLDRKATNFKESVVAPHEFNRILENPDEQALLKIKATANPTDPSIYL